jgi:hypothetical protein
MGSWSAPIKWRSALTRCGPPAGLVVRSVVHWLYVDEEKNFYTFNVNTTMAHASLTKIPIKAKGNRYLLRPPIPCIAGEGMLSFVTMEHQDHGVLELWTKQGEDNGHGCEEGWQHTQLTDLGSKEIKLVFFAESRGALLVMQDGVFYTVDLKSKEKMLVDLKCEKMGDVCATSGAGASCSSTCCTGEFDGRICSLIPPVHVLYELDWVFTI